jgi:glycosyltransferase involved in cell wall biosynthesis
MQADSVVRLLPCIPHFARPRRGSMVLAMESRGRVLFISPQPFFEWRGSPIRISFDLRALTEMGYTVDLLTFPVGQALDIPGVTVHRVANLLRVRDVPIGPSLAKAILDGLLLIKGLRMVLRRRYDVIHGVEEAGAIGAMLAPLRRSALVFEKHSDPTSYKKGRAVNLVLAAYAKVERWTARRARAVIGTGPGLVEQIRAAAPGRVHHIFDIPSSLEEPRPDAVARVRAGLVKRSDAVLITYVGSFAVYQGVDLLFGSMARVIARHPEAHFVVIGGTAENVAKRRSQLTQAGLADAVTFIPRIPPDDLPNLLAASDILCSPRLSGVNTPLKLLDYLKSGQAVLAADTQANRLILDESNAMMAVPEPQAYADAMCRLIADPALREALGRKGRLLIDETYNFAAFKQRLADCYAQVTGTGS